MSTIMKQLVQKNNLIYRQCVLQTVMMRSHAVSSSHMFSSSPSSTLKMIQRQQQFRMQSTTSENNEATQQSEQVQQPQQTEENKEEEGPKKPFVFPIDEERMKKMLLTHDEAKQALDLLIATLKSEPFVQRIEQVASMSNEVDLFAKFFSYIKVMVDARNQVANQLSSFANYEGDKGEALRTNIGKYTLADTEMLTIMNEFQADLAKRFFNIELPSEPVMPDKVAINIYMEAHKTANRLLYENHLVEALSTPPNKMIEFLEKYHAPLVYQAEMDLLKEQEPLLAVSKKKKVLYDKYMEMLKEDVDSVSTEQWEERAAITPESLTPEDERFVLATPAGWIAYKFQLSDCLYRLG